VGLDMQSSNYDKSRGEQIAWNVDGAGGSKDEKKKSEEKFFKKLVLLFIMRSSIICTAHPILFG
jgi:hypothetical protein